MNRRDLMTLIGGAAVLPVGARAQQSMPVVALLTNASFEGLANGLRAFNQGLRETGFVEGRNLAIEFHEAKGDEDRLSAMVAELVQRRVSVIVTNGIATQAVKAATSKVPIVFLTGGDPVESQFVASLNRPGGNLTGITALGDSLGPKRLQLLHEMAPAATDIGVLVNPPNGSNEFQLRDLQAAARTLGLKLHVLKASAERDFDTVFGTLVRLRAGGLVIATAPIFNNNNETLAALAVRHAIPAVYQYRNFVAGGGLISLGSNPTEAYRWLGVYVGRILNGEKPGDLPVQQVTKVELFINLKTAKAMGLTVPPNLLAIADEVIE